MELFLHIGLPKTGSSALQTLFSRHAQDLSREGVRYADLAPSAKDNKISSGNGVDLFRWASPAKQPPGFSPTEFEKHFRDIHFGDQSRALVSSELLGNLRATEVLAIRELFTRLGVEVAPFCFVRNIYDHCYSLYLQSLKRHGLSVAFPEFARVYEDPQIKALSAWSEAFPNLRVLHYESNRTDLFTAAMATMGISHVDANVSNDRVNRSLTTAEAEMFRVLNALHQDPGFSTRLSDRLIYQFPSKAYKFPLYPEVAEYLAKSHAAAISEVNQRFFSSHELQIIDIASMDSYMAPPTELPCDVGDVLKILVDHILEQRNTVAKLKIQLKSQM